MPLKKSSKFKAKDFELRKKNPISLGEDDPLSIDFKPLRIGGENTGLEFSKTEIRSVIPNFRTLKESTEQLNVTKIRGNRTPSWLTPTLIFQQYDETNDEIGLQLNMLSNGSCILKSVDDGSGAPSQMSLEAGGNIHYFVRDNTMSAHTFKTGTFGATLNQLVSMRYDNKTFFYPNGTGTSSYFSIEMGTNAATTLKTLDYGADTDASLTMDVDGDIVIDSATGNISLQDNGSNYTPSSDYHIATKKYVDDNVGGGGDMTGVDLTAGTGISIDSETNTTSGDYSATITCNVEGTEVASTGETGTTKFLRVDGDNSCSWQVPPDTNTNQLTTFVMEDGDGTEVTMGQDKEIKFIEGTGLNINFTDTTTGSDADPYDLRFDCTGNFDNQPVGFTLHEPTYNATNTIVEFSAYGNKAFVTFGAGNITNLQLWFPDVSCNCVLLLKQDGTGSRLVSNWKSYDSSGGNVDDIVWAGGSAPTLTTTGNKLDILSFFWDAGNYKAYGVASLNF